MPHIAVVDDDVAFVEFMGHALAARDWETLGYYQGEGTFELLRRIQPDLVIVDIRLEQPDGGWKLLELLRLDPRTAHIPAIICSADALQVGERELWLRHESIPALRKPFDLDELYRLIEWRLQRSHPRLPRAAGV